MDLMKQSNVTGDSLYQHFSKIYDLVTNKSKYPKWKKFTLDVAKKQGLNPKSLLDVACGTCSNSILYAREGFNVTGVDQSSGMLKFAHEKLAKEKLKANLYHQSFYKMDFEGKSDLAICNDFTTCHILNGKLFVRFLRNVYNHLNDNGIFVFDIKPEYDWKVKFAKYATFTPVTDHISYKWQLSFDEQDRSLIHMKFVLRKENKEGEIREYVEKCDERAYSMEEVKQYIDKTKFKLVGIYDNYEFKKPREDSKLWTFVLQK